MQQELRFMSTTDHNTMTAKTLKIEIGGQRNLNDWTNMGVRDNDFNIILDDIPYQDNIVDEFYWSHVIEHIPVACIYSVIQKMYKKLKPNGILRTVCPDMKAICKAYLDGNEEAFTGNINHWSSYNHHYERLGIGGLFLSQISNSHPPTLSDDENLVFSKSNKHVASFSHVSGYDFEMLEKLFYSVGFSRVEKTELEPIDPHQGGGQLHINAYK